MRHQFGDEPLSGGEWDPRALRNCAQREKGSLKSKGLKNQDGSAQYGGAVRVIGRWVLLRRRSFTPVERELPFYRATGSPKLTNHSSASLPTTMGVPK